MRTPTTDPEKTDADKSTPALDESRLQHVLGYLLAIADVPSRKTFFKYIGKPLSLRPVEFSMLTLIAGNTDVTQKQLSQALAIPAPNVTIMLDRLEQREILVRERSETDRRSQYIRLTPAGRTLADKAHAISLRMEEDSILKHLSTGERTMLRELLYKVARTPWKA
ncbi:MarR family winged helix-turn-helix transcriptional regulator [Comamonas sp. BIGb0124]|uniref:MarR family winged helix-turn-helix transcriptional regulator n=1 Tax=Comamonas sp. BIGb0124 TaxID=2485130 RepID=UPI000F48C73C|nr:MarR family winged helix-turn-helix transcriptional regulator [Comamonas sp. BIGb0124]